VDGAELEKAAAYFLQRRVRRPFFQNENRCNALFCYPTFEIMRCRMQPIAVTINLTMFLISIRV
jgi:hypothetical protein